MDKRHYLLLLILLSVLRVYAQNGKKVYADYHGVRTTRVLDGEYGNWRYISNTAGSGNGPQRLAYNPDLILDNGRENIASANYPEVGMQSQLDPDYIEYEILSAKVAKIDGFWVEWGYIDHSSNNLLQAMQATAAKYKFEIGVNICDAWLFNNNWITQVKPEIVTHDQKRTYFKENIQYLIDNVLTGVTAPRVNGKPVVYLFGNGLKAQDLKWLQEQTYSYPIGTTFPEILMRTAPAGKITGGQYVPGSPLSQTATWAGTKIIPTPWIPERIRKGTPTSSFPNYDYYAITGDVENYQAKFNSEIWSDNTYPIRSAVAVPGMDNIGCGNWSDSNAKFHMISRNNGNTYKTMWNYNLANKDKLDMVYLISWSDYTEGHEIAPTVENGDRELRTTLEKAAIFKDETADDTGIKLPYRLFEARKQLKFFKDFDIDVTTKQTDLDVVAKDIADANYASAAQKVVAVEDYIIGKLADIQQDQIIVSTEDLKIVGGSYNTTTKEYTLDGSRFGVGLPHEVRDILQEGSYEGYMFFEFFDELSSDINIVHKTNKVPNNVFNKTAQLKQDAGSKWHKGKIKIHKSITVLEGTEWLTEKTDFSIYGRTKIKGLGFKFTHFYEPEEAIDTSIKTLTVNGEVQSDIADPVIVPCNWTDKYIYIKVDPQDNSTVEGENEKKVEVPQGLKDVKVDFIIVGADGTTKEKHTITIQNTQLRFNDIVVQKWNNAFIVNNNYFTNGGYKLASYKWFENSLEIGTGQVYTTRTGLNANSLYSVEVTTIDGKVLKICPAKPIVMEGGIYVYPNPIDAGGQFNVKAQLPEGYGHQDMSVVVYDSVGTPIINQKLTDETTTLPAPIASGLYVMKVFGKDLQKTFKLLVK